MCNELALVAFAARVFIVFCVFVCFGIPILCGRVCHAIMCPTSEPHTCYKVSNISTIRYKFERMIFEMKIICYYYHDFLNVESRLNRNI